MSAQTSIYELWVDDVKVGVTDNPDRAVSDALEHYAHQHWYVIEKRTVVTFHICAIKGDRK